MVIRKTLKVLVCLDIAALLTSIPSAWAFDGTLIAASPGVEADALSADPGVVSVQPVRPGYRQPARVHSQYPQHSSGYTRNYSAPVTTRSYYPPVGSSYYPAAPAWGPSYSSPMPATSLSSYGLLPPIGWFGIRPISCNSALLRPGCKQFIVSAKVWHAKLNGTTTLWGANTIGGAGTELDFRDNLDFDKYKCIPEYEASYHMRPNWACRYSFMRFEYKATRSAENGHPLNAFWGNANFFALVPGGGVVESQWDRIINRWELVYDWFQARHAISSVFAGYALYDDRKVLLQRAAPFPAPAVYARTRSVNMHLAHVGVSIERIIRDIGGCGTVSLNCKWSLQFLEGWFGWDGQAVARASVPMNCGRFGFMEVGWRWIVLDYDRPTDKDKISMDGLTAAAGLVF